MSYPFLMPTDAEFDCDGHDIAIPLPGFKPDDEPCFLAVILSADDVVSTDGSEEIKEHTLDRLDRLPFLSGERNCGIFYLLEEDRESGGPVGGRLCSKKAMKGLQKLQW